jgi:subfamily B ATP-binding cassette protein MsbA
LKQAANSSVTALGSAKILARAPMPNHTVAVNEMIAFLRRLLGFVKPYRNRLILGILSGVLYGLANTALLVVVKVVIDLVFPVEGAPTLAEQLQKAPAFLRRLVEYLEPLLPQLKSPKTTIGIGLVVSTIPAMMLLRGLCAYLNFYLLNWVAVRAIMDLRTKLFGHLQNLSLSFFHTSSTGDLISRISNDTATLHKIISNTFPVMVRSPIAVLGLVILLFTQQPKLTLVSLAVIPICVVPIVVYGRKVRKSSQAIQNNFAELTNLMQEAFTGARIVKAYNLEQVMLDRFRASSRVFTSLFMRIIRSLEIPGVLIEFMGSIGIALVLLYVALVARKTPGDFFQFILSIIALYQPMKEVSRVPGQLEQARASSQIGRLASALAPLVKQPPAVVDHYAYVAKRHAEAALPHISSGDYAGEHWLASFAVHLLKSANR